MLLCLRNLSQAEKQSNFAIMYDEYERVVRKYASHRGYNIHVYKKEQRMVMKAFLGLIDAGLVRYVSENGGLSQYRFVSSCVDDDTLSQAIENREDVDERILKI